jgi:hypothetical protein
MDTLKSGKSAEGSYKVPKISLAPKNARVGGGAAVMGRGTKDVLLANRLTVVVLPPMAPSQTDD